MVNEPYYKLGIKPSAIRELFAYGLERKSEIGEDNVFDFSIGNPNVAAPKEVKQYLTKILDEDPVMLHSYSMGNGLLEVREAIANSYSKHYNFDASANNVFITSGAAGAIKASINAVVAPDEEIILITPYFAEYSMWAKDALAKIVEVPADKDTFQLDIDAIKNAISDKTAAILINSPNNPTGTIYSKQNLLDLAEALNYAQEKYDHPIYIICDEPYRKITFSDEVPFVPSLYNNTIVCDSASKSLSLPGERIGHVYVSDKAEKAKEVYFAISGAARALGHVCAPVMFQRLYGYCFDFDSDVSLYKTNRDLITKKLDEVGFKYVKPQGAFYLWIKSPFDDAQEFSDFAKKFEILVVPSDTFGSRGWVRLAYCVSTKIITNSYSAWDKLAKALNDN